LQEFEFEQESQPVMHLAQFPRASTKFPKAHKHLLSILVKLALQDVQISRLTHYKQFSWHFLQYLIGLSRKKNPRGQAQVPSSLSVAEITHRSHLVALEHFPHP
jgi:hypothetical protein